MTNVKKAPDRTVELRRLIVDEVHEGMRRHGLTVPTDPEAQYEARRSFIIRELSEDAELYPDWLWAQLALLHAEQTPRGERMRNFERIDGLLKRVRRA